MRTEVESLWSRDVRRLKQAIEHSLEAQRLAESVSAEHASEVREIYISVVVVGSEWLTVVRLTGVTHEKEVKNRSAG